MGQRRRSWCYTFEHGVWYMLHMSLSFHGAQPKFIQTSSSCKCWTHESEQRRLVLENDQKELKAQGLGWRGWAGMERHWVIQNKFGGRLGAEEGQKTSQCVLPLWVEQRAGGDWKRWLADEAGRSQVWPTETSQNQCGRHAQPAHAHTRQTGERGGK